MMVDLRDLGAEDSGFQQCLTNGLNTQTVCLLKCNTFYFGREKPTICVSAKSNSMSKRPSSDSTFGQHVQHVK